MPWWRQTLLAGYYTATHAVRRRAARRYAQQRRFPISVLFYHRVADLHPNAWTMPCATFARQIEWIARRFEVISLAEAQQRIATGVSPRPAVCLTFDDGYADNCHFALPLLLRERLPFTYFVSTDHLLKQQLFPHDVQQGVPLPPNSLAEIRSLADAGVEIGAHTRSHPDLGKIHAASRLRDEILGSKQDLEQAIGKAVDYFAFPYGLHANLSCQACRTVHEAGFKGFCSAYGAYNRPGEDPFHIRRIHGDPELIRVKNWLTIDPRRLRIEDFDPGQYAAAAAPEEAATEVAW